MDVDFGVEIVKESRFTAGKLQFIFVRVEQRSVGAVEDGEK